MENFESHHPPSIFLHRKTGPLAISISKWYTLSISTHFNILSMPASDTGPVSCHLDFPIEIFSRVKTQFSLSLQNFF